MAEDASAPIPLKICFPSRKIQIGLAARSLYHLRQILQTKLGLSDRFKLTLEDGTIVCDPEYFRLLEHQTKLTVVEASPKPAAVQTTNDAARKRWSPSVSASAAKRARLSPENCYGENKTDLNSNHNNSQLLSKICISSVAGNVPMSVQPRATTLSPPIQPPLQHIAPWPIPPSTRMQHNVMPQQQHQVTLFHPHQRLPVHQTVVVPSNQSFKIPTQNHPILSQINWLPHGPTVEPCIPPLSHHPQEVCQQKLHHVPLHPPIPQQHFNQDQLCHMQVERQMRTTIQMSPPPHLISPPPHLSSLPPQPSTPVPAMQSLSPHVIHYVDRLNPTKPANPPKLLKVFLSPENTKLCSDTESKIADVQPQVIAPKPPLQPFPQQTCQLQQQLPVHQSQSIAPPKSLGISRPIPTDQPDASRVPVKDKKATEDSDSDDEHSLHIVESEAQTPPSPPQSSQTQTLPSPLALPSPPQSSPKVHSPIAARMMKERHNKPANLNLSQPDDGYWSTTTSLGSADDVKGTLPFANFDDFLPLGRCHSGNKGKDNGPENNQIGASFKDSRVMMKDELASQPEQEIELQPSNDEGVQCDHSENVDSLVLTLPIKVIDGQIYYRQLAGKIKCESHKAQSKKIMVISLESDSDADPLNDVLNSQTGRSRELSLSKMDLEKVPKCESSRGDLINEDVVVADHAAEVPIVTTPMGSAMFNIDRCVAEVIDVMKGRERFSHQIPLDGTLVEENVLLDSSDLAETHDMMMGNEVVVSLEGSSRSFDLMDSNELVSSLLLCSCLPQKGGRVSSS